MTVAEMITAVNIGVQKIDSNAYDNLLEEEVLFYLNRANREYVRRQNLHMREQMEQSSRQDFIKANEAAENLKTLLQTQAYTSADISAESGYDNAVVIDISALSIFSYVYAQIKVDALSSYRPCKVITPAEVHLYSKTDYNSPLFRRYPLLFNGTDLTIFYDEEGDGVNAVTFIYIKTPDTLVSSGAGAGEVTTSELPEHTHDDIVDLAVNMILEDLKTARPTQPQQQSISEE